MFKFAFYLTRSLIPLVFILAFFCSNWASGLSPKLYVNQFAVYIKGGDLEAETIAKDKGYINKGQIGGLKGYYLFEIHQLTKRSLDYSHEHHTNLKSDSRVLWTEQQHAKRRVKRELSLNNIPDPLYPQQWYLMKGARGNFDMNVMPAWEQGYTGKGVVVTILDDGIQTNHPDLIQNYDPKASTDINGNDNDPMPQDDNKNKHGTRCAGEVAATAFNEFCGIGVAFNASIGGVRMLDGTVTDEVEAHALSLNKNHIHIYSASWGPEDDGKTVDGPGRLAKQAFIEGINQGRNGKGSIFVWASGNGGRYNDNCNCDGYTNSIYTLSISSATQEGRKPWYLEECSSTLATTYSSGTFGHDRSVVTVDMDTSYFRHQPPDPSKLCTKSHTGTSASAPIAAGLCALALEANPQLTWRDMQYIVLLTSRPDPLLHVDGWTVNGVGRKVSHKFGYGIMDAGAMVKQASKWVTVPPQIICRTEVFNEKRVIPTYVDDKLEVDIITDGCQGTSNEVNYLEHVQVLVSLSFFPRGNLHIQLVSPSGTPSSVLLPRSYDTDEHTLNNWPFLSVHFWGEKPQGIWKLIITNAGSQPAMSPGALFQWNLVMYGTTLDPIQTKSKGDNHTHDVREVGAQGSCKSEKKYWSKGVCMDSCPDGFYEDDAGWVCKPCHSMCRTCYGPSHDNCQSCPHGLRLMNEHCTEECPEGYFAENALDECLPCHGACKTCHNHPKACQSCQPGYFLFRTSCVAACPDRMYPDAKGRCRPCDSTCWTCDGEGPHSCLFCPEERFLHEKTCYPECPSGYYSQKNRYCSRCEAGCHSCQTDTVCLECRKDWKLDPKKKLCVPLCASNNSCQKDCKDHCVQCVEGLCAQCKPNWVLFEGLCVESCPDHYYASEHGQCVSCPPLCEQCTGPEKCFRCEGKKVLLNGTCRSYCPEKWFPQLNRVCAKCDESCQECHGPSSFNCTSCSETKHLLSGTCVNQCPSTHYVDVISRCQRCHHHCNTCNGATPNSCTSCSANMVFRDNACIPCKDDEYYDTGLQRCQACDTSCKQCFGPTPQECSSCNAPLRLDVDRHMCVPCCKATGFEESCCPCTEQNSKECFKVSKGLPHSFTYMVVGACSISVLMFVLLFSMLQARSWRSGCTFTRRYRLVPLTTAKFDPASEKVSLTQNDEEEDDEKI